MRCLQYKQAESCQITEASIKVWRRGEMQEVQAVVEYNLDLQDLAKDPEMPKGLGQVSVFGGKFETENRTRELRDVFR